MNHPSHRTVDRVVGILEAVSHAREEGLTLVAIAKRLGAPKSSIQDLVYGLVAAGYLIVASGHHYQLGPGSYTLTASAGAPPWMVSDDQLADLASRTGCTALVAIRLGDHAIYVNHTKDSELFNYYATQRVRRPLLTSAAGKMMLAMTSDEHLHRFLREQSETDSAAVDRFLLELPTIRSRRYSTSEQGSLTGIDAIGAPIGAADSFSSVGVLSWESGSLDRTHADLAAILIDAIASWRHVAEIRP